MVNSSYEKKMCILSVVYSLSTKIDNEIKDKNKVCFFFPKLVNIVLLRLVRN